MLCFHLDKQPCVCARTCAGSLAQGYDLCEWRTMRFQRSHDLAPGIGSTFPVVRVQPGVSRWQVQDPSSPPWTPIRYMVYWGHDHTGRVMSAPDSHGRQLVPYIWIVLVFLVLPELQGCCHKELSLLRAHISQAILVILWVFIIYREWWTSQLSLGKTV